MRSINIRGDSCEDNQESMWNLFKTTLEAAPDEIKEDWSLFNIVPRLDPSFDYLLSKTISNKKQRQKVTNILFELAEKQS